MSIAISEQTILESLRRVPVVRWGEVLQFLDGMVTAEPAIRTGAGLSQSGLAGIWADRDELGDGREFARQLRREAERRPIGGPKPHIQTEVEMTLTAVFLEVPEGFVAFVEELPGANTQGATLEESRENLREAVALVLESNRELAERSLVGHAAMREPFTLPE